MKELKVQELSLEAFNEFGTFNNMINPDTEYFGADPVTFYRDMTQQDMGTKTVTSFSICRVLKREFEINISEYHSHCGEGIFALDNDIIIHVAPGAPNGELPVNKMRVFRVPMGTMVTLKPGVFHHAPWTANDKVANVLIVLPQRTYANDCIVMDHTEDQKIKFSL
ncbi:MAG: DUF4867 family protein [Spirochaetaceae bacterium]